jgi:hypothetical protein
MNNDNIDLYSDHSTAVCSEKSACPFSIRGFIGNTFFFYVKDLDRVVSIKSNQFRQNHLLKIANINYWREHFGTDDKRKKSGVDWNEIELQLMSLSYEKGEFEGAVMRTKVIRYPSSVATMAKNVKGD